MKNKQLAPKKVHKHHFHFHRPVNQRKPYEMSSDFQVIWPKISGVEGFDVDHELTRLETKIRLKMKPGLMQALCCYNQEQRRILSQKYEQKYKMTIKTVIKKSFSGDTQNFLVSLWETRANFYCKQIRNSSLNQETISDILGSISNQEIMDMLNCEKGKDLAKIIREKTFMNHEKALMTLLKAGRDEIDHETIKILLSNGASDFIDWNKCKMIAHKIRYSCCRDDYLNYFLFSNRLEIAAISKLYENIYGEEIIYRIRKIETENQLEHLMDVIIRTSEDPIEYYALELKEALSGLNKDEDKINRIFITRSEIDLTAIEEVYEKITGKSLTKKISKNLHGLYKETLLYILSQNKLN